MSSTSPDPDPSRQQFGATPDVAVLDLSAGIEVPTMTIIDAKHVGRRFVEHNAARMYHEHARMRLRAAPVVDNVLVAHPAWTSPASGPGTATSPTRPTEVPFPRSNAPIASQHVLFRSTCGVVTAVVPQPNGWLHVLANQHWMRTTLHGRRMFATSSPT